MNKQSFLLVLCLLGAFSPFVQAKTERMMNEPDSVYLFSYSRADGSGGLKLAWSPDGSRWFGIADGYAYVNSDFGPWGSMKRMLKPHLRQLRSDGSWHCIWELTDTGRSLAAVSSPDLLQWRAQRYFDCSELEKYCPKEVYPTEPRIILLDGEEQSGWTQRVAYATVERLIRFAEHKKYRQSLYAERAAQDLFRFAGLKPVEADIRVDASASKPISPLLIGIFFEDINYAADGGLYAELVQNRDFEYSSDDGSREGWDATYAWSVWEDGQSAAVSIATEAPLHANNLHYVVLSVSRPGAVSLRNGGFDGIVLKKGERYDFSLFGRVPAGSKGGRVKVRLIDQEGREVASSSVQVTSKSWKQQRTVLTAQADVSAAILCVEPQEEGAYHLDMLSLFPRNTFRGHKNGLRADLAQTLADLKPRFVRFPGGCVAHGDGIDNMYDWKGSVGPLEERKPLRNLWGYHQTRGLGYYEYFRFCEDMGAEPLPVLAAGVPCQNSGSHTHYADQCPEGGNVELMRNGQQGGILLDKMPSYIQDVLDLVEYANGDVKSTWGRKRAEAGHPKPFNLKYIGIGNEDMITEVFEERFRMIYEAVKAQYPDITVIGTVGPFYEGTDYTEGWRLATDLQVPMVDEHYYVKPGWMIHNQDYYDRYDRSKSKVYLGEYAAHLPGRPSNVETALAEALYLTSVERNGDIVSMTSYAPLLAKEGHTQWRPDLIYFNNREVKPTVDYYTQQMYGQHSGTEYLPSVVSLSDTQDGVKKRVGVSVVRDEVTGDYIVKLVNLLPVEVCAKVDWGGIVLQQPTAVKILLTGNPADTDVRPESSVMELSGSKFDYTMPAYSFTVLRMK